MRNRQNVKIIIIVLGILFAMIFNVQCISIEIQDESNLSSLEKAGDWNPPFIHIDGNWSTTASIYDWCSGDGSWGNPYIIENVTINAIDSPTGSGILINNSKNKYFILRNCHVINAPFGVYTAGILLDNTNNGTLTNNNCSNNGRFGIFIHNCDNTSLLGNTANDNFEDGIFLSRSNDNTVSGNIANYNKRGDGIYLTSCDGNIISENTANNNHEYGISLNNDCRDNTVSGNTANSNHKSGIYLQDRSDDNTVSGNTINSNSRYGIYLRNGCDDNIISGNTICHNGEYGIYLLEDTLSCNFNILLGNILIGNRIFLLLGGIVNWETMNCINGVCTPVYIDNSGATGITFTWEMMIRHIPWFKGSGSWDDPYLIEDLTINGNAGESPASGNGILIKNSTPYFIINNCTVYNAYEAAIKLENTCNGTLTNNFFLNNERYGILLNNNCNNNTITENYLYYNIDWAINIYSTDCYDTIILRNVLVSNDEKFINDDGTNTKSISNYYGTSPPSFIAEVLYQSFSTTEFVVTLKIFSEIPSLEISDVSIQIWWDGEIVSSSDIIGLGNGLYNVSLTPRFIAPNEDPILLNMTISAVHHMAKYFETYIAVEPPEPVRYLQVEIIESIYSLQSFNYTFLVRNNTGQGIHSATFYIWWNGTNISTDVQNLGDGLYFVSLDPITVAPGENPILLNMTISASGYNDIYFETYIAIDPNVIDKPVPKKKIPQISGYNLILLIIVISMIFIVLIKTRFFKK